MEVSGYCDCHKVERETESCHQASRGSHFGHPLHHWRIDWLVQYVRS